MAFTKATPPVVVGAIDLLTSEDGGTFYLSPTMNAYDPDVRGMVIAIDIPRDLPPGLTIDGTTTQIALTINRADEPLITGTAGNDTFTGTSAGEPLLGLGGRGADALAGGAGADRFVFASLDDSRVATRDTIADFQNGSDKLDLATIDAITGGSNNAFTWIGVGAFTAAGQLRYDATTGVLEADVNGDHIADFQILFANTPALTASDILL